MGCCKNKKVERLDEVFGKVKIGTERHIKVIEDAYVKGGEDGDVTFGEKPTMELKGLLGDTTYHRVIYLKFDISDVELGEGESAEIVLNCVESPESINRSTRLSVYECDSNWSEKTITYNNAPAKGKIVAESYIFEKISVRFRITEFLKEAIKRGDKVVSFCIDENDIDINIKRYIFGTKEGEKAASIAINDTGIHFTTDVVDTKVNPWEHASKAIEGWLERWEIIKKRDDEDARQVGIDPLDYPLEVEAAICAKTDGYNTVYDKYPTRLVSTLRNYKPIENEAELYDEYGGFMGGEKYEATGFFYTKKFGDRWQTVDPLGYPFYRVACVETSPGLSDLQKESVLKQFGTKEEWAESATRRLFECGYNSTGAWSDMDLLSEVDKPLAQTKLLNLITFYSSMKNTNITTGGSVEIKGNVVPSFDPDFEVFADQCVKERTAKFVDKPYVYGWMSDNELPDTHRMLDNALAMDYNSDTYVFSYATAWTFMYHKTGRRDVSAADITEELRLEFLAMIYERYFKIAKEAIMKYDPNHQYIGCRMLPECYKFEYVNRVAGYWCDVVSFNYYYAWSPKYELFYNMQRWMCKPVIITEWYAKGMDVWEKDNRMTNKSGAGWTVRTQDDRGKFYQNFTIGLMECKNCVGFDWFKYWDNDPDNLKDDTSNRNSNKGMYTSDHKEYDELVNYMIELNHNKYSIIKYFDEK